VLSSPLLSWYRAGADGRVNWAASNPMGQVKAVASQYLPAAQVTKLCAALTESVSSVAKSQIAEIAVINRYLKKGGDIARFKPAALDPVQMRLLTDDLARMERDAALEAARDRVKSISLSAPLATGVVPFDLDGQHDNPLDFDMAGEQGEGRRCPRCNARMTKFERGPLCTDCRVTDLAPVDKRQKTNDLLAKVEAELRKRGVNPLTALDESATLTKYSPDQPRDERGRFGEGSGGEPTTGPSMEAISISLREYGGFTANARTGLAPTAGYVVSLRGHSGIVPAKVFFGDPKAGKEAYRSWVKQNQAEIAKAGWIGGWHDKPHDEVVFDPVENIMSREEAIRLGTERNQQSVWDVVAGEEIPIGGTGDRPEG
jgi:hypothetical protein